jgi:predicted nucleic acid-binding protein
VLYPPTLRNVLLLVAQTGMVQAKWTSTILDEVFRNILRDRPELSLERLARQRKLIELTVRDAQVTGFEEFIPLVRCERDPDDRHVVAAALRAKAQLIVTFNVRDFSADELARWDIEAKHPDDFLVDQFYLDGPGMHRIIQSIADSWRNPPGTAGDVLDRLERGQLPQTAALLRR